MKTKAFIPVLLLAAIAVSSCGTSYKVVETRITALNHYVDQEHPGNADVFSIANCPTLKDSPIKGKTIYWLGSSITYGLCARSEATADFVAKHNGCTSVKEATSGTSLAKQDPSEGMIDYIKGNLGIDPSVEDISYVTRVAYLPGKNPDLFVLQMSTNDSNLQDYHIGTITDSFDMASFDISSTAGAIEYILAYVRDTWGCPVLLYTSPLLDTPNYLELVEASKVIAQKWNVALLDLNGDEEFNAKGRENLPLYMWDDLHPTRAGYELWWLPKFEEKIYSIIGRK